MIDNLPGATISALSGSTSGAAAISRTGVVVGFVLTADGAQRAARWSR